MDINQALENLRGNYQEKKLDIGDCCKDPVEQFDIWMEEAIDSKCDEPNAFVLSTIKDNKPRARVVLLKGIHQNEFIFYTNYKSAKGFEVEKNDNVALTFLWLPLQRQVRVEGKISRVSAQMSDEYFSKRPRGSQLGAVASPQSQKVKDRSELEKFFKEAEAKFAQNAVIPRPEHWGGYAIEFDFIEFWQGRKNRMHDRIVYEKDAGNWKIYRLAP